MWSDDIYSPFEFSLELIEWLEKHLKSRIIGQDNAINKITDVFTRSIIRTNNIPLSLSLIWSSWIWKSMIFKEISNYLNKKTWSFKITTIDCSKLYANEITTTLFWVSSWFTWSDNKCLLETIYEELIENDSIWWHVLV